VRGLESLAFLWQEVLVPLARAMLPGVLAAIEAYAPDAVAVDHQALGGALAARRACARWATLCTTSASVVDPLAELPKVKAWVEQQVAGLQAHAGLPPERDADLSPRAVIVFSTEALAGAELAFPRHFHFVGPSISDRPDATPFPWEALRNDVPRVLVTLGTVSADAGAAFYSTVVDALRGEPLQVVLVAPDGAVPAPPPNVLVRPRVPQLALLRHVDAVVCHGGHNTVCEALAQGLPLVVTPIRDDQPVVAGQVVRAGAGVRLKYGRLAPAALRDAVRRALGDPDLRAGAAKVQASFAAAGGAPRAARLLEEVAS
jgi:MGT family glycosyltransferase